MTIVICLRKPFAAALEPDPYLISQNTLWLCVLYINAGMNAVSIDWECIHTV